MEHSEKRERQLAITDIAAVAGATVVSGRGERVAHGINIDSRTIREGEFFVAIKGERFDGEDFLAEVEAKGACGALVAQSCSWRPGRREFALLTCADTVVGLGEIARHWRGRFSIPLIAVTGSTGKSSTKELIAYLLNAGFHALTPLPSLSHKGRGKIGVEDRLLGSHIVLKSQRSFNNAIGLPLTLLRLNSSHTAAVLELGTNHLGEIEQLVSISHPTVGLITRIDPAHLRGLRSLEDIAWEKGALFRGLPPNGIAVVNIDDPRVVMAAEHSSAQKITYSASGQKADVTGMIEQGEGRGNWHVSWLSRGRKWNFPHSVSGRHNGENLVAAIAVATVVGIDLRDVAEIESPLPSLKHRCAIHERKGITVIDDCYNANPTSMRAALNYLVELSGGVAAVAVLGTMNELGRESDYWHEEIGRFIATLPIQRVIGFGEGGEQIVEAAVGCSKKGEGDYVAAKSIDEIVSLLERVSPPATILVKGSRFLQMEKIVDFFLDRRKIETQ